MLNWWLPGCKILATAKEVHNDLPKETELNKQSN